MQPQKTAWKQEKTTYPIGIDKEFVILVVNDHVQSIFLHDTRQHNDEHVSLTKDDLRDIHTAIGDYLGYC